MTIQKIRSQRVNYDIDTFVARPGIIFYGQDAGDLRLGDGITPGGIPLSVGGSGDGSGYILPVATATRLGGVKIDGATIQINNQVISVLNGVFTTGSYSNPSWITSLAYSKLSGAPVLASVATSGNYNDLTNRPTLVTSYNQLTDRPTIPTDTNQLTNGAGFITSASLSGLATETFVTTQGFLTEIPEASASTKGGIRLGKGLIKNLDGTVDGFSGDYNDLTNRPTLVTSYNQLTDLPSLFSGNYNDLTNRPAIPTDISQLTDTQGLLQSGGGTGGTTTVIQRIENPYSFNIAGDDSTLREILNGNTVQFKGTNITVSTSADGVITFLGFSGSYDDLSNKPTLFSGSYDDLSNKPTLFSGSYNDLTDRPNLFSGSYNDLSDKPSIPSDTGDLTNNAGFITSSALTGLATETYVTSQGFLTAVDWSIISNIPNFATVATTGSYTDLINLPTLFSGSYTDLTNTPTIPSIGNLVFTSTDVDTVDSSGITFVPATTFNSDVTVENDLIVVNQIRNVAGDIYVTESFVQRAVEELIGAAPEALNTLQELAAALGNDENFATTILNALSEATNSVRYDVEQNLTEVQKTTARNNISAVGMDEVYAASLIMG
jgi:hypothetical protein